MSKVAIKGAVTGSATFTLEAPAGNTDRTLVLPDTSATLITTEGGTLTGGLTLGGQLNLGSTGQIVFPATQTPSSNANTLDDYEEGTWTPSVGGNATYTNQFGRYTKIGNKVFVEGFIEINSLGTGDAGNILGLPFTTVNIAPLGTISVGFFSGAAGSVSYLSATLVTNGTSINIRHIGAGGGTAMGATTFFQNGTALFFTANYTSS